MIEIVTEEQLIARGLVVPPPFIRDHGWLVSQKETCSVSISQGGTFVDCWRKWSYEKIANRRSSTPAAELGSRVHKQRELWLKDGTPFDLTCKEGEIAIAGIEHLPPPGSGLVEHKFQFWLRPRTFTVEIVDGLPKVRTHDGGLLLVGVIDLLYQNEEGVLNVDDHKTHGRYGPKREHELRSDFQWNVYVWIAFLLGWTDLDWLLTTWHYLSTSKPYRATPVQLVARRDDPRIPENFARFVEVAEQIEQLRRARQGEDVISLNVIQSVQEIPPNPASCGKYGGCRQHSAAGGPCSLSAEDEIEHLAQGTIKWV